MQALLFTDQNTALTVAGLPIDVAYFVLNTNFHREMFTVYTQAFLFLFYKNALPDVLWRVIILLCIFVNKLLQTFRILPGFHVLCFFYNCKAKSPP